MVVRPPMREIKWLAIAAVVYSLLCVVMLLWQPQSSIEPVSHKSRGLKSLRRLSEAHAPLEGVGLSHMTNLLGSQMFHEQGTKLKWIGERLSRMANSWEGAQRKLVMENQDLFTQPKQILVFLGLLSEYSRYDFAENAYKGGFLGELVQWSDLIAALHMLGHHLVILTSHRQLSEKVPADQPVFDLVFTDYFGLFALRDSKHYALYKCRTRVLDSFGTEPLYNFRTRDFQADESLSMFNNWNLEDGRQFWTLFPHTPDNSFLGFVVEGPASMEPVRKKNQAVIYGKEGYYAAGRQELLNTIGEIMEIHSTFKDPGDFVPAHVINHGVLPFVDLQRLLLESKLFIGLGFPYDGPGPLEALASGCAFIQPRLSPPHSKQNTPFLAEKPNSRAYSSQVPYLEQYVGEPYVYTVDDSNRSAIREAVHAVISNREPQPFIPHEFTELGMLVRVGSYIAHQNVCEGRDLAVGRRASSSSALATHAASQSVDGLLTEDSCFWSAPDTSHWWMVDLGTDIAVSKLRITSSFEWIQAKVWGQAAFLDPFAVTLTNSQGNQVASRTFSDPRVFYTWEGVNERARFVRLDSLEYEDSRYFVLCAVEVFGGESVHPIWPDMTLMQLVRAKPDQSCKDACHLQALLCEPAYFPTINTYKALSETFVCNGTHTAFTRYVDFLPAVAVSDDQEVGVARGTCVINDNRMLLSCAGHSRSYERLCPCRRFTRGQIAVPPPF